MTYRGHVKNGVIVIDDRVTLNEGTEVAIQVVSEPEPSGDKGSKDRFERYRSLIGVLEDMPADWAERHDDYLREHHAS